MPVGAETSDVSADQAGLASVDLVLSLIERLAASRQPAAMSDLARELGTSKPRIHRHLRALMQHGYVVQCPDTDRYQVAIKLLALGEAVRDRFGILDAVRPELARLRDATGQTVTVSALVQDRVVVLDLLQGRTLIEFGVRPGSALDLHASAHGKVALTFGPAHLLDGLHASTLKQWTHATLTDLAELRAELCRIQARRWATAPDQLLVGVNALAAPIFDYRGAWRGTLAIVGATQFIPAEPAPEQLALVTRAAAAASARLGAGSDPQ